MKGSKNDYPIEHIEKPSGITNSPYNMIPHLPDSELFFDSRHWTYGLADGILPFSLTTRISANNQQFLKVSMKESKITDKVIQVANIVDDTNIGFENPQRGRIYSDKGLSPTINTRRGGGHEPKIKLNMEQNNINLPPELQGKKFRIRKLTPRECFRLMDVDDTDIDKIQKAKISNSSQYKLAGNAIVVSCLYYIFENLIFPPEQQTDIHGQLSFF